MKLQWIFTICIVLCIQEEFCLGDEKEACDLTCPQEGSIPSHHYQSNYSYFYDFEINQTMTSINAHHELWIHIKGHMELKVHDNKNSTQENCFLHLETRYLTIIFPDIITDDEVITISGLRLNALFNYVNNQPTICFSERSDDRSKWNIIRIIVSLLQTNNQLLGSSGASNVQTFEPDAFGTCPTKYYKWSNSEDVLKLKILSETHCVASIFNQSYPVQNTSFTEINSPPEILNQFFNSRNDLVHEYLTNTSQIQLCSQTFQEGKIIKTVTCENFSETHQGIHLETTIKTSTALKFSRSRKNRRIFELWNRFWRRNMSLDTTTSTNLFLHMMRYDKLLFQSLCKNIDNQEKLAELQEHFKFLVKRLNYQDLHLSFKDFENNTCKGDSFIEKTMFLDALLTTPTEAVFQFVVEMALENKITKEKLEIFLYHVTSLKNPTSISIELVQKLLEHYKDDNSVKLSALGIIEAFKQNKSNLNSKILQRLIAFILKQENTSTDRSTNIQVVKALTNGQNNYEKCQSIAKSQIEICQCLNGKKKSIFAEFNVHQMLRDRSLGTDTRIAAFLFLFESNFFRENMEILENSLEKSNSFTDNTVLKDFMRMKIKMQKDENLGYNDIQELIISIGKSKCFHWKREIAPNLIVTIQADLITDECDTCFIPSFGTITSTVIINGKHHKFVQAKIVRTQMEDGTTDLLVTVKKYEKVVYAQTISFNITDFETFKQNVLKQMTVSSISNEIKNMVYKLISGQSLELNKIIEIFTHNEIFPSASGILLTKSWNVLSNTRLTASTAGFNEFNKKYENMDASVTFNLFSKLEFKETHSMNFEPNFVIGYESISDLSLNGGFRIRVVKTKHTPVVLFFEFLGENDYLTNSKSAFQVQLNHNMLIMHQLYPYTAQTFSNEKSYSYRSNNSERMQSTNHIWDKGFPNIQVFKHVPVFYYSYNIKAEIDDFFIIVSDKKTNFENIRNLAKCLTSKETFKSLNTGAEIYWNEEIDNSRTTCNFYPKENGIFCLPPFCLFCGHQYKFGINIFKINHTIQSWVSEYAQPQPMVTVRGEITQDFTSFLNLFIEIKGLYPSWDTKFTAQFDEEAFQKEIHAMKIRLENSAIETVQVSYRFHNKRPTLNNPLESNFKDSRILFCVNYGNQNVFGLSINGTDKRISEKDFRIFEDYENNITNDLRGTVQLHFPHFPLLEFYLEGETKGMNPNKGLYSEIRRDHMFSASVKLIPTLLQMHPVLLSFIDVFKKNENIQKNIFIGSIEGIAFIEFVNTYEETQNHWRRETRLSNAHLIFKLPKTDVNGKLELMRFTDANMSIHILGTFQKNNVNLTTQLELNENGLWTYNADVWSHNYKSVGIIDLQSTNMIPIRELNINLKSDEISNKNVNLMFQNMGEFGEEELNLVVVEDATTVLLLQLNNLMKSTENFEFSCNLEYSSMELKSNSLAILKFTRVNYQPRIDSVLDVNYTISKFQGRIKSISQLLPNEDEMQDDNWKIKSKLLQFNSGDTVAEPSVIFDLELLRYPNFRIMLPQNYALLKTKLPGALPFNLNVTTNFFIDYYSNPTLILGVWFESELNETNLFSCHGYSAFFRNTWFRSPYNFSNPIGWSKKLNFTVGLSHSDNSTFDLFPNFSNTFDTGGEIIVTKNTSIESESDTIFGVNSTMDNLYQFSIKTFLKQNKSGLATINAYTNRTSKSLLEVNKMLKFQTALATRTINLQNNHPGSFVGLENILTDNISLQYQFDVIDEANQINTVNLNGHHKVLISQASENEMTILSVSNSSCRFEDQYSPICNHQIMLSYKEEPNHTIEESKAFHLLFAFEDSRNHLAYSFLSVINTTRKNPMCISFQEQNSNRVVFKYVLLQTPQQPEIQSIFNVGTIEHDLADENYNNSLVFHSKPLNNILIDSETCEMKEELLTEKSCTVENFALYEPFITNNYYYCSDRE